MQSYHAAMNMIRASTAKVMSTPAAMGAKRGLRIVFAPVIAVGGAYSAVAAQAPFTTGFVTTGLKTTAADAFAQLVVEKREKMDWQRNAMFTAFGFVYLGGFQYWLYNVKFTQWTPAITKLVGKEGCPAVLTFLDQCIHHPLSYFPCFYILKAAVEGRPMFSGNDSAMARYSREYWECYTALWKIWVPAQMINFTFTPRHLRIPFVAATSFIWTVTLSLMQGVMDKKEAASSPSERKQLDAPPKAPNGAPDTVSMQRPLGVHNTTNQQSVVAASVVEVGENR
jgi:hypothetical protein